MSVLSIFMIGTDEAHSGGHELTQYLQSQKQALQASCQECPPTCTTFYKAHSVFAENQVQRRGRSMKFCRERVRKRVCRALSQE